MHVHAFQIVGLKDMDTSNSEVSRLNEWRDTVAMHPSGTLVKFKTSDFAGITVLHCHEFEHEDMGTMGFFLVNGKSRVIPVPSEAPGTEEKDGEKTEAEESNSSDGSLKKAEDGAASKEKNAESEKVGEEKALDQNNGKKIALGMSALFLLFI